MPNFVISRGDLIIEFISSTGLLVSAAWISTILLTIGLFIPHTGAFTAFLHRLGGAYFLFSMWTRGHGSFLRSSSIFEFVSFDLLIEDSVYFRLFFLYSTFFIGVFFIGRSTRFLLSKRTPREFPLLVLFMHLGGLFLLRFSTFIDLLLALEIVTLASYVLVSFERQNRFSTYAGIQYFLVGSVPSARLLLGFSFFYLQGGSLVLQDLDLLFSAYVNNFSFIVDGNAYNTLADSFFSSNTAHSEDYSIINITSQFDMANQPFFNLRDRDQVLSISASNAATTLSFRGFFLLCFNLLFKLTAAPFHFWAPSVYGKAPIASITFLSIYSKIRVFFFLYLLLTGFLHFASTLLLPFFIFCGLLSLLIGRIGAFTEKLIKRFFVFSSRGHVGFRLAGFALSSYEGFTSVFHYLPVYRLSSVLRWFILLSRGREKVFLIQFSDLKLESPILAIFFAFLLFSRSGIPPFAGFFVKLDILSALFDSSQFLVNYIFFFFTVASFFYYLRVIKIIYFDAAISQKNSISTGHSLSFSTIKSTIAQEVPKSETQYWIRSSIFLFLSLYILIIQKPFFLLQNDRLLSHFN